jgi:acetyl esterase/lipase
MSEPNPDELLAQTRAFNAELERLLATLPSVHTLPPEETRQARREGRGIYPPPVFLPEARVLQIDGPAGPLPLRVIDPPRPSRGVFLHLHGGGWTLGENDMQDPRLSRLATDTGLTVVSIGYRLAPEHPYPAGPDDCEAAALWLVGDQGRGAVGAGPLAIGGDSAGGHLTAVTLLRLRDRHGITGAFSAAVFQYGAFDLSKTPSQRLWGDRNLVLSGMPPAIFTVGTEDALLDDSLFMEARWRAAGATTELRIWPEAPHGFLSLPMTVTEVALAAEHDYLHRTLRLEEG